MVRALRVPAEDAEDARLQLRQDELLSRTYIPCNENGHIYLPLNRDIGDALGQWKVVDVPLSERPSSRKGNQSLKAQLESQLTPDQLGAVRKSVETIGDVVILETDMTLPSELEHIIGQAVLDASPRAKVVLRKLGGHEGIFRIQRYQYLAGEERTTTVAVEAGISLKMDIAQVYYSPRSAPERLRMAALVQRDERVLVMFCGVGPYVCILGCKSAAREVIGVELNESAYRYCQENIELNSLQKKCLAVQGDVVTVVPTLGTFDRIIMPMPHTNEYFISTAAPAVGPLGTLHMYFFDSEDAVRIFSEELPARIMNESGRRSKADHIQRYTLDRPSSSPLFGADE